MDASHCNAKLIHDSSCDSICSPQEVEWIEREHYKVHRLLNHYYSEEPKLFCDNSPSNKSLPSPSIYSCNINSLSLEDISLHSQSPPEVNQETTPFEIEDFYLQSCLKQCAQCLTTVTPLWRRGLNQILLCNKCGLKLKRKLERERRNSKITSQYAPFVKL